MQEEVVYFVLNIVHLARLDNRLNFDGIPDWGWTKAEKTTIIYVARFLNIDRASMIMIEE